MCQTSSKSSENATSHPGTSSKINMAMDSAIDPANPPMEAVSLVVALIGYGLYRLPQIVDGVSKDITRDIIAQPLFPDVMSKYTLAYIRLTLSLFFFLTTVYRFFKKGHTLKVPYLKHSKLVQRPIVLDGIRSQVMFTQWCWNMHTISFFLNGCIALQSAYLDDDNEYDETHVPFLLQPNTLRFAIIVYEISAPASMLVSTVTKYALWPRSLKSPIGSRNLRKPVAILQHNFNVVSSLMEVGVLGRLAVRAEDWSLVLFYGCNYVIFMWSIKNHLANCDEGGEKYPQFVYFFFDTTLGRRWIISVLLSLMAMLMLFYFLFTAIDDILIWVNGGIFANLLIVGGLSTFFCRVRD